MFIAILSMMQMIQYYSHKISTSALHIHIVHTIHTMHCRMCPPQILFGWIQKLQEAVYSKTHQIQMQLTETPSQVNHWLFDIIFDALNSIIIINIAAVINIFFIFFCLHSMEGVINGPSVDKISTLVWSVNPAT